FAQHIVGITVTSSLSRPRAGQRGFDVFTENKMRTHELHGLARGGAKSAHADPSGERQNHALRRSFFADDACAETESESRGRNEKRAKTPSLRAQGGRGGLVFEARGGREVARPAKKRPRKNHQGPPPL